MDKEGQSVQFSSDKIPEKQKPDFFVASNDQVERRKRLSVGTFFSKIGSFFKTISVKFINYVKHPFRSKHKVLSILLIIVIIATIILILLNALVWQKTKTLDTTPLSDEELEIWNSELIAINTEARALSDDDLKTFYTNLINDEKNEYKSLSLTLDYAKTLSVKGFVDDAANILNAINVDDLTCEQMIDYYAGFFSVYDMINNGSWSSEMEYYANLINNQISICDTGEPLPDDDEAEGDTMEEVLNEE